MNCSEGLKSGDMVKWTFAKTSDTYNKNKISYFGILLEKQLLPEGSWIILLQSGERVHADITEIELIKKCK